MIDISIKSNIEEIDKHLKDLKYFFPNLVRKIFSDFATKTKRELKKANTLGTKSGVFKSSFISYVKKQDLSLVITVGGKSKQEKAHNKIIANVAESGANIIAVKKPSLAFINERGILVRPKKVVIRPKPFFERTYNMMLRKLDGIINSVAEKLIKKELEK